MKHQTQNDRFWNVISWTLGAVVIAATLAFFFSSCTPKRFLYEGSDPICSYGVWSDVGGSFWMEDFEEPIVKDVTVSEDWILITDIEGTETYGNGRWVSAVDITPCEHDFGCNQPYCLVVHYCSKCGSPDYQQLNYPITTFDEKIDSMHTANGRVYCDHFWIEESRQGDWALSLDNLPRCICAKCKTIKSCHE